MQLLALAASVLGIEVEELLGRLKKNAAAWAAVTLFASIGLIFGLVALNAWFSELWGPVIAPLVIAAGALVLAIACWAIIAITDALTKRRSTERRHTAEKRALVTTAAITALPLLFKSDLMRKIGIPVGGALAAAYLLAKPGAQSGDHD